MTAGPLRFVPIRAAANPSLHYAEPIAISCRALGMHGATGTPPTNANRFGRERLLLSI